jgi:DNA-binding response OmpR family regulator
MTDPLPLVLVVDDTPETRRLMRRVLERDRLRVVEAATGEEALDRIIGLRPAAVVLDVGLPGIDGIELCRRLRASDDWTPILFVTARDDEVDRVVGLELGADDYVTKPFSPRELVARVGSVLRRTPGAATGGSSLEVGSVRLDVDARRAYADGAEVDLTATEFDLIAHLMRRPGQVFSRAQLISQVWGYSPDTGSRTVDVHVAQLRAKLGAASPIRTVRGIGYSADPARADS